MGGGGGDGGDGGEKKNFRIARAYYLDYLLRRRRWGWGWRYGVSAVGAVREEDGSRARVTCAGVADGGGGGVVGVRSRVRCVRACLRHRRRRCHGHTRKSSSASSSSSSSQRERRRRSVVLYTVYIIAAAAHSPAAAAVTTRRRCACDSPTVRCCVFSQPLPHDRHPPARLPPARRSARRRHPSEKRPPTWWTPARAPESTPRQTATAAR